MVLIDVINNIKMIPMIFDIMILIEVIHRLLLVFGDVKISKPLILGLGDLISNIIFNIIQYSLILLVLGFPWFEYYNLNIEL